VLDNLAVALGVDAAMLIVYTRKRAERHDDRLLILKQPLHMPSHNRISKLRGPVGV